MQADYLVGLDQIPLSLCMYMRARSQSTMCCRNDVFRVFGKVQLTMRTLMRGNQYALILKGDLGQPDHNMPW